MGSHKGVIPHKYTPEQHQFIVDHTEGVTAPQLAVMFNERFGTTLTSSRIHAYRNRYGLRCGIDCKFKKGHEPSNKGQKGVHYKGTEKGWFKKGTVPPNYKPQWSERVTKDGYVEIKTEAHMKKWVLRSRWIWEQANGPIPRGMVVFHLNGDSADDRLENLMLLSKAEMVRLNQDGLTTKDVDINLCAINIAKIKTRVGAKKKGDSNG